MIRLTAFIFALLFISGCSDLPNVDDTKISTDEASILKLILFKENNTIGKDFLVYDMLAENEHSKMELDTLLSKTWPFFTEEEVESLHKGRGKSISLRAEGGGLFLCGGCELTDQPEPSGLQFVVSFTRPLFSSDNGKVVVHVMRVNKEQKTGVSYIYKKDEEMMWKLTGLRTDSR